MNDARHSIMQRLRSETSDLHSHAESRTIQREIAKGVVDRATLIGYLVQLYAVHNVLENALREVRDAHPAIASLATPDRMRIPDLELDLDFYGVDPETIEKGHATGRFLSLVEHTKNTEPVALLGAFYVLEGSTNGGRFLAQVLRKSWNLDGQGVTYFDPYGDRQPHHWEAFKRAMDSSWFGAEREDAIVEMAKRTFEAIAAISDEVANRS